jgi:SAM-dependent methyltransferase
MGDWARIPASVSLERRACPMGCSHGDDLVLTARDRVSDLPGTFEIVRCRCCGLTRTDPRPTPSTIGFYYPADYGPHQAARGAERASSPLRRLAEHVIDFRAETIPDMPPGRLLEIGCATGNFLSRMAAKGWQVRGVEFVEGAAAKARARGFEVSVGRIEDQDLGDGTFDLIAAWMVVEHLHEPVEALRKLRGAAAPNGWLAISVPDAGSVGLRIFGDNWYALGAPIHLFHYTKATIAAVLERAGWRVERIVSQRIMTDYLASLTNAADDRLSNSGMVRRLRRWSHNPTLATNLALYPAALAFAALGQTGRMTVLARAA